MKVIRALTVLLLSGFLVLFGIYVVAGLVDGGGEFPRAGGGAVALENAPLSAEPEAPTERQVVRLSGLEAYLVAADKAAALPGLERHCEGVPDDTAARYTLAGHYRNGGDPRAWGLYESLLGDPEYAAGARSALAYHAYQSKQYDVASDHFRNLLDNIEDEDGEHAEHLFHWALALLAQKNVDDGRKALRASLEAGLDGSYVTRARQLLERLE